MIQVKKIEKEPVPETHKKAAEITLHTPTKKVLFSPTPPRIITRETVDKEQQTDETLNPVNKSSGSSPRSPLSTISVSSTSSRPRALSLDMHFPPHSQYSQARASTEMMRHRIASQTIGGQIISSSNSTKSTSPRVRASSDDDIHIRSANSQARANAEMYRHRIATNTLGGFWEGLWACAACGTEEDAEQ
mmetsp:Transcript_25393/g.37447  ORF Transcript_25393/g.37447 Transcript_25393/m.37447 type:complete len:190 (-) Transcript_25393:287-856(-)|eukprot:CAMPEP_0185025032 /NCGR_PEP_ID=MMETSP1103-20130426/8149_1 /TAXON_ID=36769 /ORGANISM="Paraphysomonas bandaiensis, Strain Caron Lab Isolate" /LENGTH=189 /DNA_ID=CAMNT_0027558143 /DNA_START=112 /DNA_END=681 /DNA_ORIENTATION=-